MIQLPISEGEICTLLDGTEVTEAGTYTTDILDEEGCTTEQIITTLEVLSGVRNIRPLNLTLSPNPTTNQCVVELQGLAIGEYDLYIHNILGQVIHKTTLSQRRTPIATKTFESGTYWVQVRDRQGVLLAVEKLVVLR